MTTASPELRDLALVRFCLCWEQACALASLTPHLQALMPAQHLDSQQGASCLQQLQGLAALHDAIAHGRASLQQEWYMRKDEHLPGRTPFAASSAISPHATCVAAAWRDERTSSVSVDVLGHDEAGTEWRQCMPPSAHAGSYTAGWSACGRYYAYLGYADASSSAAVAHICDTQRRNLLPALDLGAQLPDRASINPCRFSDNGQLAAAFTSRTRWGDRDELTVFGVGTCFVAHVRCCEELCDSLWLPDTVLVLLGKSGLARVHTGVLQSGGTVQVRWDCQLQSPDGNQTQPRMALVPGSNALCVVHGASTSAGPMSFHRSRPATIRLSLYCTLSLVALRIWTQALPGLQLLFAAPASVLASRQAVAVKLESPITSVISLRRQDLGVILFQTQLSQITFSPDSRWVAGCEVYGGACSVLDARNGCCVAQLQPALLSTRRAIVLDCILSAKWAVHDPGLLLVIGQKIGADRQQALCSVVRFA